MCRSTTVHMRCTPVNPATPPRPVSHGVGRCGSTVSRRCQNLQEGESDRKKKLSPQRRCIYYSKYSCLGEKPSLRRHRPTFFGRNGTIVLGPRTPRNSQQVSFCRRSVRYFFRIFRGLRNRSLKHVRNP